MTMFDGICDVCEKERPVAVASVSGVPISVAYCKECLASDAEPWWVLVGQVASLGGLHRCHPVAAEMVDATCRHLKRTRTEFNMAVWHAEREMQAYFDAEALAMKERGEDADIDWSEFDA